jgi:hypothetical protein
MAARVHLELQDTPAVARLADAQTIVGTWLSLVERTLGVGEVASSNLVVPTNFLLVRCVNHYKRIRFVSCELRVGGGESVPLARTQESPILTLI